MKTYTGIGARKTPSKILIIMNKLSYYLNLEGYHMRSGGAEGADKAFSEKISDNKTIYLPWSNFNDIESNQYSHVISNNEFQQALEILRKTNTAPYLENLRQGAKKLYARNVMQVLGSNFKSPTKFVVCWTPDGAESREDYSDKTGGTGIAINLASHFNIPVFNLKNEASLKKIQDYIEKMEKKYSEKTVSQDNKKSHIHVIQYSHQSRYEELDPDAVFINVTSRNKEFWGELSPFRSGNIQVDGLDCKLMENAWQFSKVYEDQIDENGNPNKEWFKWRENGFKSDFPNRHPKGKDKKPLYFYFNGKKLDHCMARKQIYIPLYLKAVRQKKAYQSLVKLSRKCKIENRNLYLVDFDADLTNTQPDFKTMVESKLSLGHSQILKFSLELIKNRELANEINF